MAARTNRPYHTDKCREKIQTTQLLNRLSDHALGVIELETTQVKAIEILLRKTLPDLTATSLSGPDGGPIQGVLKVEHI